MGSFIIWGALIVIIAIAFYIMRFINIDSDEEEIKIGFGGKKKMVDTYGKRINPKKIEALKGLDISKFLKVGGICLLVLALIMSSFKVVDVGHRGVRTTFGKPTMVSLEEGLHFKIPIAQKITEIEVRKQKIEVTADSASKDLQDVQTIIALNFHLDEDKVPKLYQEIGKDYASRIINPSIQESVKATTAKFTAEELITRRAEVRDTIMAFITGKLVKYDIIVDDFNIVDFKFSEEFDKAIEAKVTAVQLKLKAEEDLKRIEVEARQAEQEAIGFKNANIAQAEGEARAIEIVEKQLTKSRNYIEWYKINKWNGELPTVTAGMPFIDVTPVKSIS